MSDVFQRRSSHVTFRTLSSVAWLWPAPPAVSAYYGEVIYGFLPVVQKVSLVSWVFWLFGLSLLDSQAMKPAGQLNGEARVT